MVFALPYLENVIVEDVNFHLIIWFYNKAITNLCSGFKSSEDKSSQVKSSTDN